LPVHVINNSRAAALAEYSFGGHGAENLLVVKIGSGVGAGVILDGRIHVGEDSAAGEIGHVVVDPDGLKCFCGKVGCLETVAAAPRLLDSFAQSIAINTESLADGMSLAGRAAARGHVGVHKTIDDAAGNLARVLSTTVAILDVHKVVISGVVSRLGDPFIVRLREDIENSILPNLAAKLDLGYGHTGDQAVRMGAAAFVANQELGII
jgi:predicted NBD/HSP70 family sugar kinase